MSGPSEPVDWGCPDGSNMTDYAGNQNWSGVRWRWEFKRRTQQFRQAFMMRLIENNEWDFDRKTYPDDIFHPDFQDELLKLSAPEAAQLGMAYLPNPRKSAVPDEYLSGGKTSLTSRTLMGIHLKKIELGSFKPLDVMGYGQIAIVFDPSMPIAPQIEGLSEHLEGHRYYNQQADPTRWHHDKRLTYLRILDAREQGFSWSKCAGAVLPKHVSQSAHSARDTYKAAVRYQEAL